MKKVTCSKGHVYDADKHSSCPYCGVNIDNFNVHNNTQPLNQNMQPNVTPMISPNINSPRAMGMNTQPLDNAIASPQKSGKTEALESFLKNQKGSEKTAAIYDTEDISTDPVVGWVVCIDGLNKGKDYKILSGGNKIGRNKNNSIEITGDDTISREHHAEITYDPIGNAFYLTPGTSRGLAYLNNSIVLVPQKLNNYDHIKIGKTELIFISLCGDLFTWN